MNAEIGVSASNNESNGIRVDTTLPGEGVRGLFRFDISGLPAGFTGARLAVRQKFAGLTTWHAKRITGILFDDWTASATWDTADGALNWVTPGGDFVDSVLFPTQDSHMRSSGGMAYLDVRGHLADALAESLTTLNILVKQVDESILTNNGTIVDSIESGPSPPMLLVDYPGESRRPYGRRPYNNRPWTNRPANNR